MAANLPFRIGDSVFDRQGKKGIVVDYKQLENNDPSHGQFSYKVEWESKDWAWVNEKEISKPSFWQNLWKKFAK